MVDSPHKGRVEQSHDDTAGNSVGRSNASALRIMVEMVTELKGRNLVRTNMRTASSTRLEPRARASCVTIGGLTSTPS
jgi:hypothetical protein